MGGLRLAVGSVKNASGISGRSMATTRQLQLHQLHQLQPQLQLQLPRYNYNNINYSYNYNYTTLHHTTSSSCGEVTTANTPKSTTPTTFRSSGSLCHSCITPIHFFHSFPCLKLSPPPWAVLLVIVTLKPTIQSFKFKLFN